MIYKKGFNNNVALVSTDSGTEVIIMGKGISFKMKQGDLIDETKIEKTFVLNNAGKIDKYIELFNNIPIEDIELADKLLKEGLKILCKNFSSNILITLSDHISFAIKRAKEGIEVKSPLSWEVKLLFPEYVSFGEKAIELISKERGVKLPESEAVFIAIHFLNSELDFGSIENTIEGTEIISKIVLIIKKHFNKEIDENSLDFRRFITHLRYFIMRQKNKTLLDENNDSVYEIVKNRYPDINKCVNRIKKFLDDLYGWKCTDDELLYLILHINRLIEK